MDHCGHRLDVARAVFPVDPCDIEAEGSEKARCCHGAESEIYAYEGWDFAVVGIAEGFAGLMGLEKGWTAVDLHALGRRMEGSHS